jgi:hypothetical protein
MQSKIRSLTISYRGDRNKRHDTFNCICIAPKNKLNHLRNR